MSPPPSGALAQQLLRLGLVEAGAAAGPSADGLARWLGWADAIALAGALQGPTPGLPPAPANAVPPRPAAAAPSARRPRPTPAAAHAPHPGGAHATAVAPQRAQHEVRALAAETLALRQALLQAIDSATQAPLDAPGFADWRSRHGALQQRMADAIDAQRAQLRAAVTRLAPVLAPGLARVAALDAVLHQALDERAQALLGLLPARLEPHHIRLHAERSAPQAEAAFAADLRRLLQAELAHRLQPVDGLIEALQAALRTPHR